MAPRDESNSPPPPPQPPPPSSGNSSNRHARSSRHSPPQQSDSRRRRAAASSAAVPADYPPQSPNHPPVSAGRLHYSLPPLPGMNPNYPPHHSPYLPHQHYPPPPHHHHLGGPPPVPPNAPPLGPMYPYGMPPHAPPYAHHPYGHHYQYGPMGPGGFPPPRPPEISSQPSPHQAPASTPTPPSSNKSIKRKRKPDERKTDDDHEPATELKKRTKTQRACDSCRSRKIRCDILPDSEPPLCQHCKQYGFDCTFFLPITETRFKKKRTDEEVSTTNTAATGSNSAAAKSADDPRQPGASKTDVSAKGETKVLGPTSTAFLLHSTATVPSRAYENYDQRYNHTWELTKSGDGFIQVHEPPSKEQPGSLSRTFDLRLEREVVEKLVNSYFTNLAPIFPVVTREEFLSTPSPSPVLLYAICSVAAASRDVPPAVFDNLRNAVNSVIKSDDVLSTTSTVNLQALLILGMCGDCHSQFIPNALSAYWLRTGIAIRMGQDLGLHRAESVKQNIELRRRLWASCVITDRWCSLTYGHPIMIDLEDCDMRMTVSDRVEDMYMNELLKLSILIGRVLKMIYSPSGLVLATDESLTKLLEELDAWNVRLPSALQFTGVNSNQHAGLLRLFYSSVLMLFWRVFMRISYTVPAHLTFVLTVEKWSELVTMTRESIEWLDANEQFYDVWMLVAYCATSCAFVQYHTWARRQDPEAAASLRKLRDCIKRWEGTLTPDHRSTRRKTAEIIALLYESTQMPVTSAGKQGDAINPTVGVRMRGNQPDSKGLVFKKDPSRPGGGIFVAVDADYSDLPTTVVASTKNQSGEENQGQDQSQSDAAEHGKQQQPQQTQQQTQQQPQPQQQPAPGSSASIVNYTPLPTPTTLNLNPRMNAPSLTGDGQRQVQLMNVLDSTMGISSAQVNQIPNPEQLMAETVVDGLPAGSMFDWEQWETFFSRFGMASGMGAENAAGTLQAFASHAAAQAQAGAATLAGIGRNRPINIAPQPSNDQRSLDALKGK